MILHKIQTEKEWLELVHNYERYYCVELFDGTYISSDDEYVPTRYPFICIEDNDINNAYEFIIIYESDFHYIRYKKVSAKCPECGHVKEFYFLLQKKVQFKFCDSCKNFVMWKEI